METSACRSQDCDNCLASKCSHSCHVVTPAMVTRLGELFRKWFNNEGQEFLDLAGVPFGWRDADRWGAYNNAYVSIALYLYANYGHLPMEERKLTEGDRKLLIEFDTRGSGVWVTDPWQENMPDSPTTRVTTYYDVDDDGNEYEYDDYDDDWGGYDPGNTVYGFVVNAVRFLVMFEKFPLAEKMREVRREFRGL